MPANNYPIVPAAGVIGVANVSTANTARTATGTTNLTQVVAAGSNGTRVDAVRIQATVTTTAGMVRLWWYSGSGNAQLINETAVSAVTASATAIAAVYDVYFDGLNNPVLVLPTGGGLYASTEKSEAFNVVALGGDY